MTDTQNISIYLSEQQFKRLDLIVKELTNRSGVKISRSAAVGRAIDSLFLTICPTDTTDEKPAGDTAGEIGGSKAEAA